MNSIKYIICAVLFSFSTNTFAALSELKYVRSIESRTSGYHAIYLEGDGIPDEGCSLNDRAIIRESTAGGKSMLQMALSALTAHKPVVIKVEGCTAITPDKPQVTVPNVKKVQIFY